MSATSRDDAQSAWQAGELCPFCRPPRTLLGPADVTREFCKSDEAAGAEHSRVGAGGPIDCLAPQPRCASPRACSKQWVLLML